jgi:hypothetical protein
MFAGIWQLEELIEPTARSRFALGCASVGMVSRKVTGLSPVYRRTHQEATRTIRSFYEKKLDEKRAGENAVVRS